MMTGSFVITTAIFTVLEALGVVQVVSAIRRHSQQDLHVGLAVVFFVPMLAMLSHNPLAAAVPVGIQDVVSAMSAIAEMYVGVSFLLYARKMRREGG
jgi:uncharacterized membrane protein HdeD (DUF308 family)